MIVIQRNRLNALAAEALGRRTLCADAWQDYMQEIAGLPVAMRRNGVYLAFAYVMEREAKTAENANALAAPGRMLFDLRTVVLRLDQPDAVPGAEVRVTVARWVDGFADVGGDWRGYMAMSERLFAVVDAVKRVAQQKKILAGIGA